MKKKKRHPRLPAFIPAEQPAGPYSQLGVDDGCKAWLNGRIVLARNVAGAAVAGSHKARLTLAKGWPLLLLKITQANGPWEFCAQLRAPDSRKLEGVRIDCTRE